MDTGKTLDLLVEYLVDPHVGIVNHVFEQLREPGSPDFFRFVAQACDTTSFSRQANFRNSGGASTDRGVALSKAIGEAIERYCAAIYDVEKLPLRSFDKALFPCVHPASFALFSSDQYKSSGFPFVPFSESAPIRWTAATDLNTGRTCYVPAAMVFLPYTCYLGDGESSITEPISTGLACQTNYYRAAISAICEVIERDAFMICWQARLNPPRIRLSTVGSVGDDLVKRFERAGSEVYLFDITLDTGVPTILSVERCRSASFPALTFAAASSIDPEVALRKSLEELSHTARFMKYLKRTLPQSKLELLPEDVVEQVDHLAYWSNQKHRSEADFLFTSKEEVDFASLKNVATGNDKQDLNYLVSRIKLAGYNVLVCDVTSSDIRGLGMSVIRALIPGFHPLFMGHRYRALGGQRLWNVPQKLGYSGISPGEGDNIAPHPYP